MKLILRYLAGSIVVVALILAAVGAFTIYFPERAWKIVRPIVLSKDTHTGWASATFDTDRSGWKKWRLNWAITGLKVVRAKPKIELQLDVKFKADISFFSPRTEIKIEWLEIKSIAPAAYQLSAGGGDDAGLNPFEYSESLRRQFAILNRMVTLDKLGVVIDDLTVIAAGGSAIKLHIDAAKPASQDPQGLELRIKSSASDWNSEGLVRVKMAAFENGQPFLNMNFNGKGAKWTMSGQLDLAMPEKRLQMGFRARGMGGEGATPIRATADGQLSVVSNHAKIQGRTDFNNLPGRMPPVKNAVWSLDLPLRPGVTLSRLAGDVKVSAPIELSFIRPETRAILEKNCACQWPTVVTATIEGKVWPSHLFDSLVEERPVAVLNFKFDPIHNSLLVMNLGGELRIVRSREQEFKYTPLIDANVKLPDFRALKGLLEANRVMVPAPFDILEGAIEANVKTNLWRGDKGMVIPIDTKVNLTSTEQKVNLTSKISLAIPDNFQGMDVSMDVMIHDFVVEMPPLDPIHGFPQLTKDSRLRLSPEESVKAGAFKFRLLYALRTAKPGAVRLLSKLAKPGVPITMDLDRTAQGDTLGSVKIEPFELSYLHRSMHVEQLRMIVDDRETADFAVDGLLRVENSQYKITIAVSGSLRSPLIKLSSEPELSRSDIISVLLYDRTSDQLVSADRETVGSFEAAVSDRAIGLLGLWVFASTPIRSFSYNPLTKVYIATVRLSDSTTASIGTNWEEAAQLEVRKRVTRRWVLTASWAPSEAKEQMGKLVLQWEKRF